jgi:hypothetical protein
MTRDDIENLQTEGTSGLVDLDRLAKALGYNNRYQTPIEEMLEDNPGMIEALYNYVLDNEECYKLDKDDQEICHTKDADCHDHLVDGECQTCGVFHGDACPDCGGRGYHRENCIS